MRVFNVIALLAAVTLAGCSDDRTATAPAPDTPITAVSATQNGEDITVTFSVQRSYETATLSLRTPGPYTTIATVGSGEPRSFTFNYLAYDFAPGDRVWYSVAIHWSEGPNDRSYAWYDYIVIAP